MQHKVERTQLGSVHDRRGQAQPALDQSVQRLRTQVIAVPKQALQEQRLNAAKDITGQGRDLGGQGGTAGAGGRLHRTRKAVQAGTQ